MISDEELTEQGWRLESAAVAFFEGCCLKAEWPLGETSDYDALERLWCQVGEEVRDKVQALVIPAMMNYT